MDAKKNLKRVLKGHGSLFTDTELISTLFRFSAVDSNWVNNLNSIELKQIRRVASNVLSELPFDVEAISAGVVTPNQSASVSLGDADTVPKSFLIAVCAIIADI